MDKLIAEPCTAETFVSTLRELAQDFNPDRSPEYSTMMTAAALIEQQETALAETKDKLNDLIGLFPICAGCDGKIDGERTELCDESFCSKKCVSRAVAYGREHERMRTEFAALKEARRNGLLVSLRCKVGDTVFVDSKTLPAFDAEEFEEDGLGPAFVDAKIVSIRKNCKSWFIKFYVLLHWRTQINDPECGPYEAFCLKTRYFTFPMSSIGSTVFYELPAAPEEQKGENNV